MARIQPGRGPAGRGGRWHDVGDRVIYASEHYATAMLPGPETPVWWDEWLFRWGFRRRMGSTAVKSFLSRPLLTRSGMRVVGFVTTRMP